MTVEVQTIVGIPAIPTGDVFGSVTSGPLPVSTGPFMQTLDFSSLALRLDKEVSYALVVKLPASAAGSVGLYFAIGTSGTAFQSPNAGATWFTFAGDD